MKKMLFTAIAMVAFSAVSMANTIEVKDVEVVKSDLTIDAEIVEEKGDYWDCAYGANLFLDNLDFFEEAEAYQNADSYFNDCMGYSTCQPPFTC